MRDSDDAPYRPVECSQLPETEGQVYDDVVHVSTMYAVLSIWVMTNIGIMIFCVLPQ